MPCGCPGKGQEEEHRPCRPPGEVQGLRHNSGTRTTAAPCGQLPPERTPDSCPLGFREPAERLGHPRSAVMTQHGGRAQRPSGQGQGAGWSPRHVRSRPPPKTRPGRGRGALGRRPASAVGTCQVVPSACKVPPSPQDSGPGEAGGGSPQDSGPRGGGAPLRRQARLSHGYLPPPRHIRSRPPPRT